MYTRFCISPQILQIFYFTNFVVNRTVWRAQVFFRHNVKVAFSSDKTLALTANFRKEDLLKSCVPYSWTVTNSFSHHFIPSPISADDDNDDNDDDDDDDGDGDDDDDDDDDSGD